jgi:CubicO group peptidase (beta-lactamase class C family)
MPERTMTPRALPPVLLCLLVAAGCATPSAYGDGPPRSPAWPAPREPVAWPGEDWQRSTPEAAGLSSAAIAAAVEHVIEADLAMHSLTVVRGGVLVLDVYFDPFPADALHDVASVTKSVLSLVVGTAVDRGELPGPDAPLAGAIRAGDLLAMRAGFRCDLESDEGWLETMRRSHDWGEFALSIPAVARPGRRFGYCSAGYHLLSARLQTATGRTAAELAATRLFEPLGITSWAWPGDPQGVTRGWGDLRMQPRDLARLGLLVLHHGRWDGRQIVSPDWIARSLTPHSRPSQGDDYGLGWWLSRDIPGLVIGVGRGGQRLFIWPAHDIITVTTGGGFDPGEITPLLVAAIRADTALPADPAGAARLDRAIAAAARPAPAAEPGPLPALAAQLTGRTYRFPANPLGMETLTLEFHGPTEARVLAGLEERMRFVLHGDLLDLPVGLDGRPRVVRDGAAGPVAAATGWFQGADGFVLDLDFVALGVRITLDMRFQGNDVAIEVSAPAIRVRASLVGSAVEPPEGSPAGDPVAGGHALLPLAHLCAGAVPFQAMPALGGEFLLRGYFHARYRNRTLVALASPPCALRERGRRHPRSRGAGRGANAARRRGRPAVAARPAGAPQPEVDYGISPGASAPHTTIGEAFRARYAP